MSADAQALLDATRLFLARHEEALASGDPTRSISACEGLIEALGETLPGEIGRAAGGAPRQREARDVLMRRISEVEGLAMQLKLGFHQVEAGTVDVMRLVALLTATRRQLRALRQTLELWGVEHGAAPPQELPAMDALRAAREALAAGCAAAAREALKVALRRAGESADVGTGDDLVSAWRALDDVDALLKRY